MKKNPGGAPGGHPLSPQPQVHVTDWSGNVVPSDDAVVEARIEENGGIAGTLSGTVALVSALGLVEFSDLSIDLAGERYTLGFHAEGLAAAICAPFDMVRPAPCTLNPEP